MKSLIIFTLVLASASALELPKDELKPRRIVVPAGRVEGRIVNGRRAQERQFPFQVALETEKANGKGGLCGGSLISHTKVLTAAHCLHGAIKATLLLGSTNRRVGEKVHVVTKEHFAIHSAYNDTTAENDIAIITIPYTPYSKKIQPVKLPSLAKTYPSYEGEEVIAIGWGLVSDNATENPYHLQYVHIRVAPIQICRRSFGEIVKYTNICVETVRGGSICNGDSGGPLVLASTGIQIGLTSFGSILCERDFPIVLTRLTSYLEWIKRMTAR